MQIEVVHRLPGQPVQDSELYVTAHDECVELQMRSKEVWTDEMLRWLGGIHRWEITAKIDGKIVGGVIIGWDHDVHVGPCISVWAQYVLPEYRGQGVSPAVMRRAMQVMRQQGAMAMAWTHRAGPWHYETKYRRLRSEDA